MNDTLRRAIFDAGLSEEDIAARLGVDPKTVSRWIREGRLPYPRLRWRLARLLGVHESDLWPELKAVRATRTQPDEVRAVYPHRYSVSRDGWRELFESAESEIGILVYSGLFLAEDADILRTLADRASAGVRVRIALGDPDGPEIADRGAAEGIDEAMAAKIRNALVLYKPLTRVKGVELRLHRTVLYNSIYLADNELLVNQHAYGIPASHAPVYQIHKTDDGDMYPLYANSFDRVWTGAGPIDLKTSPPMQSM